MRLRVISELPAHFGVTFYQCEEVSIDQVVAIGAEDGPEFFGPAILML